jgi:hypothetical protein
MSVTPAASHTRVPPAECSSQQFDHLHQCLAADLAAKPARAPHPNINPSEFLVMDF